METISVRMARRLALARAGLLKPQWTGFPNSCGDGRSVRARRAAFGIIQRFGYLQLDTVSIAGMRSHANVLVSRLDGFDPKLAEDLLRPGEPLFEYWGHEASWMPLDLFPVFAFRRRALHAHPWWGDVIQRYPKVADNLMDRIRFDGPLRSKDMEGRGSRGWWDLKIAKQVASALWSRGTLAIAQRRNFQRVFDLTERVIPSHLLKNDVDQGKALEILLLRALAGHGWATTSTLAQTWRLVKLRREIDVALRHLKESGGIISCTVMGPREKRTNGWIRPDDLELASRLERTRPRRDRGVLLSPFDPILWDRGRVEFLFGFHQILEIFKPAPQRRYGYYCLPVLAGEHLVARLDLKAHWKHEKLLVLARHFEGHDPDSPGRPSDAEALGFALNRYAQSLGLSPEFKNRQS